MCGILAVLNASIKDGALRVRVLALSKRLRHRGPDWSGVQVFGANALAHERLAIVDVENGFQPLTSLCQPTLVCIVNGEIYNHQKLRQELTKKHQFKTESDSEIVLHLYEEFGDETPRLLDGDFAFILQDGRDFLVARDPMGVVPLYRGWGEDGSLWFASEMKAIHDVCVKVDVFPPGCLYSSRNQTLIRYYQPLWLHELPTAVPDHQVLRQALTRAVTKRLMADVPYAVLLSGGLDSSLITAIMSRHLKTVDPSSHLHSFAVGLLGSPDLLAAREVAEFLGTTHHEVTFSVEEGLDALPEVIYHMETLTSIRAGVAMYFLARRIKSMGFKMVLSGEGADEVFGSYFYFHKAPNQTEFHKECVNRIEELHFNNVLRANKATMAWGLEVRVPFLDRDFLNVAMSIDPSYKMFAPGSPGNSGGSGNLRGRVEKNILRLAFDTPEDPYLPQKILWRQKEQFSDGVGHQWIDGIKKYTDDLISDEDMGQASTRFPDDPPTTKEVYFYRKIFETNFPNRSCFKTVKRWVPRADWGCGGDSSGRSQQEHAAEVAKKQG